MEETFIPFIKMVNGEIRLLVLFTPDLQVMGGSGVNRADPYSGVWLLAGSTKPAMYALPPRVSPRGCRISGLHPAPKVWVFTDRKIRDKYR